MTMLQGMRHTASPDMRITVGDGAFYYNETKAVSPSMFERSIAIFDENIPVETIPHTELKQRSRTVKAIVRTGDFTAYTNVILISGADDRWYVERQGEDS
jgi:D-ribose pyranose/furanose isomerase RbsD